jgi:hypothetical protein
MDMSIVYGLLGVPYGMPLTIDQWDMYYREQWDMHYRVAGGARRRRPTPSIDERKTVVAPWRRSPQCSSRPLRKEERMSRDWNNSVKDGGHLKKPAKPREGRWMKNQFVPANR